jgi:hypothetical protein
MLEDYSRATWFPCHRPKIKAKLTEACFAWSPGSIHAWLARSLVTPRGLGGAPARAGDGAAFEVRDDS